MDCVSESDVEDILTLILEQRFPEIKSLAEHQEKALHAVVNRKDVFAILPTGHGKSIIFQLLPDVCKYLYLSGYSYPHRAIILVVCPLTSLVDSHIRELQNRGISAASLSIEDENNLLKGAYSFVFGSAELSFLQNEKWRNMLRSDVYQDRTFAIVADEVHVVPKWGFGTQSKKEFTAAFRECFSRLGELRSLAPQRPLTPMLALTATATLKTQVSIERSLCLRKDCVKIFLSPNRRNIYLYNSRVTSEIDRSFQWLVDKLKNEKTAMDKTIIYCKSIKDYGRLFMFFKSKLGEQGYYPEDSPKTSANLFFGMYHHSTLDKQKSTILNSFHEEKGTVRLVFATNALGMGVNFSNVRTIIHYGPPREMEDFVQQIGRAGRDGQPSKAVLLYNGLHLKNCEQNIKQYCSSNFECLRKLLLAEFGFLEPETESDHDCCVHCHKDCLCKGEEGCSVSIPVIPPEEMKPSIQLKQRDVTKEQRTLLTDLLIDYKEKLSAGLISYLSPECTTVFTNSLIKMVLKHSSRIFTKNYILDNLPVFKTSHAVDILCMFHDVFEDIDLAELEVYATSDEEFGQVTKYYDLEYGGIYQELAEEFCPDSDVLSDNEEFNL